MHSTEHPETQSPEAAEYLGISVSTLSKRRVDGDGPKYLKLGRRVVYDTRDLDDWLNSPVERRRPTLATRHCRREDGPETRNSRHPTARPTAEQQRGTGLWQRQTPQVRPRASCSLVALPAKRLSQSGEMGARRRGRTQPTGQGFAEFRCNHP